MPPDRLHFDGGPALTCYAVAVAAGERPVAGYFRVSLARDNMRAPELYEDEIVRYCKYKKVELAKVYSDIDYSAFRGAKPRPSLEQLIGDRQQYSAIIIPKLSRFGRSMKELVTLFELFDNDGIPLVFLDMNLDTSTSQGRLLRHILAAFAEYESDVKADYTRASQRMIAEQGRPTGPRAPFGYIKDGGTYRVDPGREEIVQEVFRRFANGASITGMARDFARRGIRGSHGGSFSPPRIRRMLDSPAYIGLRSYNGETYPANWPAIVDKDLWAECQRIRRAHAPRDTASPGKPSYLLSGLIYCDRCGHKLRYKHEGKAGDRYVCPTTFDRAACPGRTVMAERAERLVTDTFFDLREAVMSSELKRELTGLYAQWNNASVRERYDLLATGIEKVVLLPRKNRGKGRNLDGHQLQIRWRERWAMLGEFSMHQVVPSTTVALAEVSPESLPWNEYQRELRQRRVRNRAL